MLSTQPQRQATKDFFQNKVCTQLERPTENVLRGWVNFEVTRPGADIVSVLRPTENVLRGWVNFEVTRPGANIISILRPTENTRSSAAQLQPFLGSHDGANLLMHNLAGPVLTTDLLVPFGVFPGLE
ncbi:hypothetical protein Tco_0960321 [Tanacetum coccineum]